MKNIPKLLICCVLLLFSCQVEQFDQKNLSAEKKPDQIEENSGEEADCETFFALGDDASATCFLDDGFNRWGWTNGPLTYGEYTFDLYAGAGQCDTEKGTLVGILTVNYDELTGTAEIGFEMLDGFVLSETHLYIGNEPYPTNKNGKPTVAPGQFPYQFELEGVAFDPYTINDLSGEIYVIGHGVVCSDDSSDDDDDGGGDDNGGPY
jgi:hypothetical protein